LLTAREPEPGFCRADALNETVTRVVLTTVVGRDEPFHKITEFDSNPVPVMVIVAAAPGEIYRGEMEVMAGVGLLTFKSYSC
jgi:hypothetical protein